MPLTIKGALLSCYFSKTSKRINEINIWLFSILLYTLSFSSIFNFHVISNGSFVLSGRSWPSPRLWSEDGISISQKQSRQGDDNNDSTKEKQPGDPSAAPANGQTGHLHQGRGDLLPLRHPRGRHRHRELVDRQLVCFVSGAKVTTVSYGCHSACVQAQAANGHSTLAHVTKVKFSDKNCCLTVVPT